MSRHYNPESSESYSESKIIFGNPNGIANFSETPHRWAYKIYRLMENNAWFPEECNLTSDKQLYLSLPDDYKYSFKLALAQLIENDSVQTSQLAEDISRHITSKIVKNAIVLQAYQEANHSRTYTDIAESVVDDLDTIYYMYKHDPKLNKKNLAVSRMYEKVTQENAVPTVDELLLAFAANQILEELIFPVGFITLWSFNLPGVSKAISFIHRDEAGTHVPLFKNIFRTTVSEHGISDSTVSKIKEMISELVDAEKEWAYYLTKPLLGFTKEALDMFIEHQANSICKNLNIDLIYKLTDGGPLINIVKEHSLIINSSNTNNYEIKSNFFETKVGTYAKNMLDEYY